MALEELGMVSVFLTNREPRVRDRVRRCGFESYTLDTPVSWDENDLKDAVTLASRQQCRVVVVDSDHEGAHYLQELRRAGLFVCAIEDFAPHPFPCQLVVNGDAHARQVSYQSTSGDTRWLLGPEYSLLRPEFWHVAPRMVRGEVRNILVMLGGADPYNLMPSILEAVDRLPGSFTLTAVIGPFFEHRAEVESAVQRAGHPARVIHSPDAVRDLMVEADLAVSAGGQTLYELARVGCPAVSIQISANQEGQSQVFHDAGFIRAVGRVDDPGIVDTIGEAVRDLLHDAGARASMGTAGQRMIDGQGALRVARSILSEAQGARECKVTVTR